MKTCDLNFNYLMSNSWKLLFWNLVRLLVSVHTTHMPLYWGIVNLFGEKISSLLNNGVASCIVLKRNIFSSWFELTWIDKLMCCDSLKARFSFSFSITQAVLTQAADLYCSPSSHRCNLMRHLTLCWQEEPEQWATCICLAASSSNGCCCFWTLLSGCPNGRERI